MNNKWNRKRLLTSVYIFQNGFDLFKVLLNSFDEFTVWLY